VAGDAGIDLLVDHRLDRPDDRVGKVQLRPTRGYDGSVGVCGCVILWRRRFDLETRLKWVIQEVDGAAVDVMQAARVHQHRDAVRFDDGIPRCT
jgi:hypothetical protein